MHTSTGHFSLLFCYFIQSISELIEIKISILHIYMYCFGLFQLLELQMYLLTGKSCRLQILTCLKPISLASMVLLSAIFYPRHRSSHPKTSLNSFTSHRNNISGQWGSKPRVSEHASSAPPVNMYGTTSLPWCVFIYIHIYIRNVINFGVSEWENW